MRAGLLALVFLTFALDQALKLWSSQAFTLGTFTPFVPGVLDLGLTHNTGMAWSLLSGAALPLALLRLVAGSALLVFLWRRGASDPRQGVALAMIAGGALGNAADGLRLGYVVDMLSSPAFSFVTRALNAGNFPVFNLADVWVVSGVGLLLMRGALAGRRNVTGART